MNYSKNIIVGMSGGVDSSISAVLLKELGYKVTGLFMKNWEEDDIDNNCSSKRDYEDAKRIAEEASLDLVEVAPNAKPPVCRVMDLGKFIYQRKKKEREARRAQTKIEVKEIRLRPKTSEGHIQFKVDDARRWLQKGNKVKVRIQFRGREMHYPEIAMDVLKDVAERLQDVSIIEYQPSREGRSMLMILAPDKGDK